MGASIFPEEVRFFILMLKFALPSLLSHKKRPCGRFYFVMPSNSYWCLDRRVRIVTLQFKVFELEIKNTLDIGIDLHLG